MRLLYGLILFFCEHGRALGLIRVDAARQDILRGLALYIMRCLRVLHVVLRSHGAQSLIDTHQSLSN